MKHVGDITKLKSDEFPITVTKSTSLTCHNML